MPFVSINPATGRRIGGFRSFTSKEIDDALTRGHKASLRWRQVPLRERANHLRSLARSLRAQAATLAELATAEMGKPIVQARAEVEKCALVCEFYASHAATFLAEERPVGAPRAARVQFQPLGVVLAIMPWNFPFWQVFRAAAPALVAGNVVLLKHAPNVGGCAEAIARIFDEAGLPSGVLENLFIPTSAIPAIIADRRVRAVTLTGSVRAGKRVAALAGAAMKKGVFELGGSDPYLILEDADLEQAAEACASSRLINSGQSCVCAKRFIVVSSVRRPFEKRFAERLEARRVGDPRDPETAVGPLARADLRAHLQRQTSASIRAGARVLLGGDPIPGAGFFYSPTLLTGVEKGMPAFDEELFGPVASVIAVRDEEAAIRVANDSRFGLGAAVFSRKLRRARAVAEQLEAGFVAINDFVRSDPALPFGGVKESGHGRELGSFGILEFVNIKTVCGSR